MHKIKESKHLSGKLHVCGTSRFIGEENIPVGMKYIGIVTSKYAHAEILDINTEKAWQVEGVVSVITAKDIPGENNYAHGNGDNQPLLPADKVMYYAQPVAIVVAEDAWTAEFAANAVEVTYKELKPILSIDAAVEAKEYYINPRRIEQGDIEKGLADADLVIEKTIETGAQEHFYLETQRCMAIPEDNGCFTLYSSTQSTSEMQEVAGKVLGLSSNQITVDVKRLGGAFGGKESQATLWGSLAALGSYVTNMPALLQLRRPDDMNSTGKRHPFKNHIRLGIKKDGTITAFENILYSNGGAYTDLSIAILERGLYHSDHAYHIPNARFVGYPCRTNLAPNTAFRGFGAPQGIISIEYALDIAAAKLGIDPIEIRRQNCYQKNQMTPYGMEVFEPVGIEMFDELKKLTEYEQLKTKVENFNLMHKYKKQGIGVVPGKFGISFTAGFLNQGSSLIWIYADGTISVSHGGIEMGQQVNTKVAQIVAETLGVKLERVRVETANTKRVGNASPTAASTGSDINGYAALDAANKLKDRLLKISANLFEEKFSVQAEMDKIDFCNDIVKYEDNEIDFAELVHYAYMNCVDLGAHGYYHTPGIVFDRDKGKGRPFAYFVYGAALSLVEVDALTGEYKLKKVSIVHDTSS
ncbi:MAG: molybdopterin-dependent oxidoreductase, partial [Candidatus Zophobacter franzmannii]|nr:molybdopterin-dependent oxidoreductase [Candidatus Zophobacter franzmannii]